MPARESELPRAPDEFGGLAAISQCAVSGCGSAAGAGSGGRTLSGGSSALGIDISRPLTYTTTMEFEWDDAKSDACLAYRGFEFAYAIRAFLDDDRIIGRDRRWDYGEDRYRLLGAIEGRVFVVIYTMRGSAMRIISARKANGREVREYEQNTRQD